MDQAETINQAMDQSQSELTPGQALVSTLKDLQAYQAFWKQWRRRSPTEMVEILRLLYRNDLFALMRWGLNRPDAHHPWVFERAREVQQDMDGYLDLWSREHYKSSIITHAGLIYRMLQNPEITIGLFSHTKPIAKGFLRQIKYELEGNQLLKDLFPEIFWEDPKRQAPKWTEDEGLVIRRKRNPKELTLECSGLVDGQPTSRHYSHRHYDDVVTLESVTTPQMIRKVTAAFEMSDNLGTENGSFSMAGTIYAFGDTYMQLIKREAVKVRKYTCTLDATENFTEENCVLMRPETLAAKRRVQGARTFGTQMLLDPKGDSADSFQREWINWVHDPYVPSECEKLNIYILVDPANEKKASSDYTAMWVIGLGPDDNYYCLDFVYDKMKLSERTNRLFELHRHWKPLCVFYEQYGMQADVSAVRDQMRRETYNFNVVEVGGSTPKNDRIRRLQQPLEDGRFYIRRTRNQTNYEGVTSNIIEDWLEQEYLAFPVCEHDDGLDCLARIRDPKVEQVIRWPARGNVHDPIVETSPVTHPMQIGHSKALDQVAVTERPR